MYEGPLDLLLDLIKQQKMNIHDIQISQITAAIPGLPAQAGRVGRGCVCGVYLYGGHADLHQVENAAAAGSLEKREEAGGDPRAELVQRLVEHEKFKNAAQLLYQKQQIEENVWSKPDKSLYNDEGTEGEAGGFRWWIWLKCSSKFWSEEGSFADRAAARRVYRGADDRGVARADSGQRGEFGELDSVF